MIKISLVDRTVTLEDTVTKHKVTVLVSKADLIQTNNTLTMWTIREIFRTTLTDRQLTTTDVFEIGESMEDSPYIRNQFIKLAFNISA